LRLKQAEKTHGKGHVRVNIMWNARKTFINSQCDHKQAQSRPTPCSPSSVSHRSYHHGVGVEKDVVALNVAVHQGRRAVVQMLKAFENLAAPGLQHLGTWPTKVAHVAVWGVFK